MIEICQFTPEDIGDAIAGLDGLRDILVPVLDRAMDGGHGSREDVQQFIRHLTLAKHALAAMADILERRMGAGPHQRQALSAALLAVEKEAHGLEQRAKAHRDLCRAHGVEVREPLQWERQAEHFRIAAGCMWAELQRLEGGT